MNEDVKERAAIKEYSGNIPRAEAERQAKAESVMCSKCSSINVPLEKMPCFSCTFGARKGK